MALFGGSPEIVFAIVRPEERADRKVVVEREECTGGAIEAAYGAADLFGLQHRLGNGGVAEILSK
jgi:hypothetical protein